MNKDDRNKVIISKKLIVSFTICIIGIPILVNLLLFLDFPSTPSDLGNKEWLSFWASFIGGSIGGVATLVAIYYTLLQNNKNHLELMGKQDDNNQLILEQQNELKRVDVIPFIVFNGLSGEKISVNILSKSSDKTDRYEYKFDFPSGYIVFDNNTTYFNTKLIQPYKAILENAGYII